MLLRSGDVYIQWTGSSLVQKNCLLIRYQPFCEPILTCCHVDPKEQKLNLWYYRNIIFFKENVFWNVLCKMAPIFSLQMWSIQKHVNKLCQYNVKERNKMLTGVWLLRDAIVTLKVWSTNTVHEYFFGNSLIALSWMPQNTFDDKSTWGSGNGLVPLCNKPLPEPHVEPDLFHYMASLGHNELRHFIAT